MRPVEMSNAHNAAARPLATVELSVATRQVRPRAIGAATGRSERDNSQTGLREGPACAATWVAAPEGAEGRREGGVEASWMSSRVLRI